MQSPLQRHTGDGGHSEQVGSKSCAIGVLDKVYCNLSAKAIQQISSFIHEANTHSDLQIDSFNIQLYLAARPLRCSQLSVYNEMANLGGQNVCHLQENERCLMFTSWR